MKKLFILAVGAVGYVLGTRAGRERYEQIKQRATKAWKSPTVQGAVSDVEDTVRHTAADVGSKVTEAAGEAKAKVAHKVKGSGSEAPVAADYVPPPPEPPRDPGPLTP